MRVSINCPSYKRPKVETLEYLTDCKVWVAENEYADYVKQNDPKNIIKVDNSIQGNVCRIRNHIIKEEIKNGYDVVCIVDDDLKGVYYWEKLKDHKVENKNFKNFLIKYTILAQDIGAKLWGINVNKDKQVYREYSPFSTVSYLGAPFQVFLKDNNCWYDERLPLKEDYDMTLQQLNRNRVALRVNKYYYNVKQSEQSGGCASYRNYKEEKRQLELLQKKWGKDIVKVDQSNRSHNLKKKKTKIDYNPVIKPPIKGI